MANALTQNGIFGELLNDPEVARAFSADRMLHHMLSFEIAWTEGLRKSGRVSGTGAAQALSALAGFQPDMAALGAGSERDGVPVPALVKALRAGLSDESAAAIHTGATSQDVVDTALVLILREVSDGLDQRLTEVLDALADLRARFGGAEMMGRTRMQAALPVPVSRRIDGWSAGLRTRKDALSTLRLRVEKVQVGGPVGFRDDHLGEMAGHVAKALSLGNAPVWHSDRSSLFDYGAWLAGVAGALGKLGQDIALMAQQGVDEVVLARSGGSSAMPLKQNPVLAETLVTLARYTTGQLGVLGQCLVHEQERSGAAWALEWMVLPDMCEATGTTLRHAMTLLGGIERLGRP